MSDHPHTVEHIYEDFQNRRSGLVKALTDEVEEFYRQCDPDKDNLCLYGERDGTWSVDLPAEEVPPELPEPCLGINFARDGMQRKDWLALVAVHADAWLIAVAFFYGVKLNSNERKQLFTLMNQGPTLFEIVQGRMSKPRASGGSVSKRKRPTMTRPGNELQRPTQSGRLLTYSDITPALKGRNAELFWPDDDTWYTVTIIQVNTRSKSAKILYTTGEEEDLDLDEIVREGHMSLT